MSTAIESFVSEVKACASKENTQIPADYLGALTATMKAVESWCDENKLGRVKKCGKIEVTVGAENFDVDTIAMTIGPEKVVDLCKTAKVAPEHMEAAAARVSALLAQTLGQASGRDCFLNYNASGSNNQTVESVESLYPSSLHIEAGLSLDSLESFGIKMDRVEPDLKTILTIALLQFHTNLTPRIMPIQTVTQGNVTIVRESMEVYDLSDIKREKPTRPIELYKDPSMVSIKAQRIVPLKANDTTGNFLIADNVYLLEKQINMFDLALDANKPGWDKFNHTDFVEDNIVLDGVLVKITNSDVKTGDELKPFYRMIPVPAARGRLTQITNDARSSDRRLSLDRFPVRVISTDAADTLAGYTSDPTVIADLTNGTGLAIDLRASVHVDRRNSMLDATAWIADLAIKGGNKTDAERATLLAKFKVETVGFTLDARYNEDNKRKTSIRAEMFRRSMSYELPAGRTFVVDAAIGQDGVVNAAARLAQLEHIGRDGDNLKIIEETMKAVHDQNVAMNNDKESQAALASMYAAGDLVNPYVYMDRLDYSGMIGIRSADASGDIKQYTKQYFTRLTSALLNKTFFAQQLAAGASIVFRTITSPEILGNLFMAKHIHAHLDNDQAGTGGVEHVITLDNNVKLEIVTTTFDSMADKVIILPYLANSQASVLNFATVYDQGTLVGAMSVASDSNACYHRMFTCTRQLCIPTNVMGAIITVTGTSNITLNDMTNSLTVSGITEA